MNEPKPQEGTAEDKDKANAEQASAAVSPAGGSSETWGQEPALPLQGTAPETATVKESRDSGGDAGTPGTLPSRSCRRCGAWALVAGIVALLLTLGAYAYARHVVQQEATQRQALEERLAQLEQGSRCSEESFQQFQGSLSILTQRLDAVQRTLGQVQGQVDDLRELGRLVERLTQALAQQDERRLLVEARDALTYAQRRIDWANDLSSAIAVLAELDARLAKESKGLFLPLRQALARDLERLRASPRVDLDGILARLDALESRLPQLALAFASPVPETAALGAPRFATETPAEESSSPAELPWHRRLWQTVLRWTDEVLAAAARLVRLERLDAVAPELLSPQQRLVLEENLRLWLASARLAAQAGDEARYRAALEKTREALVRFYATQDPAVTAALATLDELAAQPIAAHRVALTESFAALAQIEARLQVEAASAPAP